MKSAPASQNRFGEADTENEPDFSGRNKQLSQNPMVRRMQHPQKRARLFL